jgi:putative transposase
MQKIILACCPKCSNSQKLYRYGKDKFGNQKYLCRTCFHQSAPDTNTARIGRNLSQQRQRKYPSCPRCNKSTFLHHDYEHYSNYRCSDKKFNHSFFVPKPNAVSSASMSRLFGKTNFILKMISLTTLLNALTSNLRLGTKPNRGLTLMNLPQAAGLSLP